MFQGQPVMAVIPCRNEARFIARTVAALPPWLDGIIVVDDASSDATAAVAEALPRVRVVRLPENLGVGGAVVRGYREALAAGAELVVVTNGDGQMSGHEVPELLRPLLEGSADLVKGNRLMCPGTRRNIPWGRRLGIEVYSALTRVGTGWGHISDSQSGFHAVTRAALLRLPLDQLWPGYGFPNDLLLRAAAAGLRVVDRPVRAIYGDEESELTLRRALYPVGFLVLRGVWRRWRGRP